MSELGADPRRYDEVQPAQVSAPRMDQRRERAFADGGQEAEQGIGSLISGLLTDLQDLVRGEIALAKTEMREDAANAMRGLGMMGAGALFALTGFIFLMLGVTYLLNKELEMWLSAAIVGAALAVIAAIMLSQAKSKLSAASLKPEQSIESLKEDGTWARQQMSSVKK